MSEQQLPKTAIGGIGLTVAGTTVYFGWWQIVAIGLGLVGFGIVCVRFGWRRKKSVDAS